MSDASKQGTSTMRSLERAIDVLEVLENAHSPLRLSEIARRADLHVATAQRILTVLQARNRVEQDSHGYRTGASMLFAAHSYLTTSPLATAAPAVLQQLADSTGLTASVFVRVGNSRAVVSRVEGKNPLRYVLPTGQRLPLHLGAGKVLLAYLPPETLDEIIAAGFEPHLADENHDSAEEFRAKLDQIRAQGWAFSTSERVVGISSVAAPVPLKGEPISTAIQASGPATNNAFTDLQALSTEVRQAAAALAERIG